MNLGQLNNNKINYKVALTYWFSHFATEVLCFFSLYNVFINEEIASIIFLLFDALAFTPQVIIGRFSEKHKKFRPGLIGGILLIIGTLLIFFSKGFTNKTMFWVISLIGLFILTIGNSNVHISGALETLKASNGKLSESAIFVSGGSFGIIVGKILANHPKLLFIGIIFMIIAIILMHLTKKEDNDFSLNPCKHDIASNKAPWVIILILVGVIIVRSYIGYGLPTAWNKTILQTICLYVTMGIGKMLGGILSDIFGARIVGVASCLLAIPFLLLGNNIMFLSLIGVALFSMTMAVTLGGIVSVSKENPGVSFGYTTLALFIGTVPTFFFPIIEGLPNYILIATLSIVSSLGLFYCLKSNKIKPTINKSSKILN